MRAIGKNRMEGFSDGVIAIIVTIMVLELKVPHDTSLHALLQLTPVFLSYAMSFVVVAIIWVNHHHLLHTLGQASGRILWLNNHLLFWLSLVPFTTAYVGENHLAPLPVALYGLVMCCAGMAFDLLRRAIAVDPTSEPELAEVHARSNRTNAIAASFYLLAMPLAWLSVWLSLFIYLLVPVMYFMPGRTIEKLSAAK